MMGVAIYRCSVLTCQSGCTTLSTCNESKSKRNNDSWISWISEYLNSYNQGGVIVCSRCKKLAWSLRCLGKEGHYYVGHVPKTISCVHFTFLRGGNIGNRAETLLSRSSTEWVGIPCLLELIGKAWDVELVTDCDCTRCWWLYTLKFLNLLTSRLIPKSLKATLEPKKIITNVTKSCGENTSTTLLISEATSTLMLEERTYL